MISAAQLQQFSRECLLVRKALQDEAPLPEFDFRILMSGMQLVLADLIRRRLSTASSPINHSRIDEEIADQ